LFITSGNVLRSLPGDRPDQIGNRAEIPLDFAELLLDGRDPH
jgi:hypothetical protein